VTHEDTIEEETEDGLGSSVESASSMVETHEGQWRFDNKREVVSILIRLLLRQNLCGGRGLQCNSPLVR